MNALSRTLGPDFYTQEIVESTPPSEDPTTTRDVTPERFSKLEKELVRGKAEVVSALYFFGSDQSIDDDV